MTIKEIDAALEEGESLKVIAQAYSEIANLKVKKIKANVERNRAFFQEISTVYALVRRFAIKKKINIIKPKKAVCLVITSNHGFYGSINSDLLRFFVRYTKSLDTDRVVLNKTGIDYFRTQDIFTGCIELQFKNDQPDSTELISLVNLLKDYNQVLVFFPSMKSLLVQQPSVTDITASSSVETSQYPKDAGQVSSGTNRRGEISTRDEDFQFIFEPELPKILQFFDSQVTTLLLEEIFLEAELSRTAARFISMDEAESASNKLIKEYQTQKTYAKRAINNNMLLENFATIIAARKEED